MTTSRVKPNWLVVIKARSKEEAIEFCECLHGQAWSFMWKAEVCRWTGVPWKSPRPATTGKKKKS